MAEMWSTNRQLRASSMKFNATDKKWGLTHEGKYKKGLDIQQKASTNTSSHCAMIHIPPLPLLDGTTNYSAIQTDLVIRGTFELDFTIPKDVSSPSATHALGEVWDDCVDPSFCPYDGYGLNKFKESRVQWVTGIGQYIPEVELKVLDVSNRPAIDSVYGLKDLGSNVISGSSA